jgi:hypothetical protein
VKTPLQLFRLVDFDISQHTSHDAEMRDNVCMHNVEGMDSLGSGSFSPLQ